MVSAPRRYQLELRHDDEIIVDVSDRIFLLLGSAVHAILEWADTSEHLVEERMVIDINGWQLSGKPDLLDSNQMLSDYKTTSVYAFTLGDKPEWEAQLNLYRLLYEEHGFEVTQAQVVAILKDHSKARALSDKHYPPAGALAIPIPIWPLQDIKAYALDRIKAHQEAAQLPDEDLPLCTEEDRWCRPDWAIVKPGARKARRAFVCEEEAKTAYLTEFDQEVYELRRRPGKSRRCELYCLAAPFCNQWQQIKREEG